MHRWLICQSVNFILHNAFICWSFVGVVLIYWSSQTISLEHPGINHFIYKMAHIDGLVPDCSNFTVNALELPQFCAKSSIWVYNILFTISKAISLFCFFLFVISRWTDEPCVWYHFHELPKHLGMVIIWDGWIMAMLLSNWSPIT